ncbi:MAG: helix-turn-helix domain-containing protein [Endomicrobiales bacterium]
MSIGENIKFYRKLMGINLEKLSKASGISKSYLSLIENGRRDPRSSVLERIAEELNLPVDILLTKRNTRIPLTNKQLNLLQSIKSILKEFSSMGDKSYAGLQRNKGRKRTRRIIANR